MMSCRHRIQCRPCPPHRGYTCHVIRSSCGPASLCLPLYLSPRLPYRFASLRLSPRPSCRRAGRCRICGRGLLASYRRRCQYDASIATGRSSLILDMISPSEMWRVPSPACLLTSSRFRPSSSRIGLLPVSTPSRSFAPFSRVDERGAISACSASRHPSLLLCSCVSDVMLGGRR